MSQASSRLLVVVLALFGLLGTALVATPAQAAGTGIVTGVVKAKLVGSTAVPHENAWISLDRLNEDGFHDNSYRTGYSAANGRFTITNVPNGRYDVRIYPETHGNPGDLGYEYYKNKWSPYGATTVTVSGGTVTLSEILLEQPGWVTGTVRDEAGNPMPNVSVGVRDGAMSGGYGAQTNSQGRYTTRENDPNLWTNNTIPGSYIVSASQWGYGPEDPVYYEATATVNVAANQQTTQDLVLKRRKTVVFSVQYSDGSPVRNAPVGLWLQDRANGQFGLAQYGPIETDSDGKFRSVAGNAVKLKFNPARGYAGSDAAEYWDGPSGTGAFALRDAVAIEWPGSAAVKRSFTVKLGPPPAIAQGKATIKGTPKLGSQLKVKTSAWPKNVKLHIEWEKDGARIKGATKKRLKVTKKVAKARNVSVRVTATRSGDRAVDAVSKVKSVKLLKLKAPSPKITGKTKVGKKLTVNAGKWGPGKVKLGYQWFQGKKPIAGATKKTLKLTKKFKGSKLRVTVTGSKVGYLTATKSSRKTAKIKK